MTHLTEHRGAPFVPARDADPHAATEFTCALCGQRFTHGGMSCDGCPLNVGCDSVSCPRCGHAFPRSSRLVSALARIFRRRRRRKPE